MPLSMAGVGGLNTVIAGNPLDVDVDVNVDTNAAGTCTKLLMSQGTSTGIGRSQVSFSSRQQSPMQLVRVCVWVCLSRLQAKIQQTWPGQRSSRRREISCEISMSWHKWLKSTQSHRAANIQNRENREGDQQRASERVGEKSTVCTWTYGWQLAEQESSAG